MEVRSNGEARALGPGEALPPSTLSAGPAIPPLPVSGLVVTKTDLLQALRVYLPQVVDLVALDGEFFMLKFTATNPENNGRL